MKNKLIPFTILAMIGLGCHNRKCTKGHWIHRHRDQTAYVTITNVYGQFYRGGAPFPHTVIVPARDWKEYVCDEYKP